MQLTTIQPQTPPNRPAKQHKITPKVMAAIEAMVWDALPRAEAAQKAGMTEHGLYKALRKAPIKAAYLAELDVLRTSERARNIHTALEVRDQRANPMARMKAVDFLEGEANAAQFGRSNMPQLPGLVVQVITTGPAQVEAKVIEHDATE